MGTDSPAYILGEALIETGAVTDQAADQAWPVYTGQEPIAPDDVVTIYDTTARKEGRLMATGETLTKQGVQVRVRGKKYNDAYRKAKEICLKMDGILDSVVIINAEPYNLHNASRLGDPIFAGRDEEGTRPFFTINAMLTIN